MAARSFQNRSVLCAAVFVCRFDVYFHADYADHSDHHSGTTNAAEYDEIPDAGDDAVDWLVCSLGIAGLLDYGERRQLRSTGCY